jgi:hypothetical protein
LTVAHNADREGNFTTRRQSSVTGEDRAAMETLSYRHTAARAAGSKPMAIVGVVTSGNLEVMVERCCRT